VCARKQGGHLGPLRKDANNFAENFWDNTLVTTDKAGVLVGRASRPPAGGKAVLHLLKILEPAAPFLTAILIPARLTAWHRPII